MSAARLAVSRARLAPATPLDDDVDVWTDGGAHPTAGLYTCPAYPAVTLIHWHAHGRFTARYDGDGMHATLDASTLASAIAAAYAYAEWPTTWGAH